jgi:aspartyl-tRNA(Asn)/glutamyl-tRNA(Gln) amidotransferase subunit A
MTNLTKLTISAALEGLEKGEFTSRELTQAHINEIEKQRDLNAYIVDTFDLALKAADDSDAKRKNGNAGLMEGIPVGVKDLFCTKDVRSTSCSHILDGFTPTYESTVTSKLFDAGAIMLGKTNMDEMAMGSTNATSYYGAVKNPWKRTNDNTDLVPGGSSGGSAAAVAAGLCLGALGSDTGGSVRQPAAFCGVVGMKPTYGMCSRWGMIAFASSLDQAGVFTRSVKDSAIMLEAISGHDAKDSTLAPVEIPQFSKIFADLNIKGLRVGIPKEYRQDGMPVEIDELWKQGAQWLKEAGAKIVDISLPHTKYALPTYYIIAPAEAAANLARYDGVRYGLRVEEQGGSLDDMYELTRAAGFGAEVKRRIMIGTYVLSAGYYDAYYKKAQRVRTLVSQDFTNAFDKVDVILTPTTPTPAFALGEKMDPVTMYLNDVFTVPASLAGLPGISVPAGFSAQGTPLGLQIIGKAFHEETVFKTAAVLELAAGFKGIV